MGKVFNTVVFLLMGYFLPLLGRPALLLHYKVWVLIAAALAIFLTQPGFKVEEAAAQQERDRNSVLLILLCSLLSAMLPLAEWAYFHSERHHPIFLWLGVATIIAGIALRVWAIQTLGDFFTATIQIAENHRLIQHGPYRWIRHPSYTGAFLAVVGSAVVLESWPGLLIAAILMLAAYGLRIRHEEKALAQAFGKEYADYQGRTARLLPFIW